ncbi:hypothetical protein D3C73_424110 [compost metagenome]
MEMAAKRKTHRGRVFLYSFIFVLVFVAEFAVGYYVSHIIGYVHSDSMSRVANAFYVLYSRDPHLAAIGFVWNPLPSIVDLIFLLFYPLYPPLASSAIAGVLMTSTFAAMTAVMLVKASIQFGLPTWAGVCISLLFAFNPFMFLFGANGLSDAPFLFFIMWAVLQFSLWVKDIGVGSLVQVAFALALAFWTRYEAVPLGAAITVSIIITVIFIHYRDHQSDDLKRRVSTAHKGRVKLLQPWRYQLLKAEGTIAMVLAPVFYSGLLWILFNYMIMGNPLYFLNGDYSNVAQAENLSNDQVFASMKGNLFLTFIFVAKKTMYYSIPLASIVLLRTWNRRRLGWDFVVFLTLFCSIISLQYLLLLKGTSYGWFRYFMYVFPITVAWLPYELSKVKRSFSNYAIVFIGLGLSAVVLTKAMMSPVIAPDENKFLHAAEHATVQNVDREIAQYLQTEMADQLVLMDSYSTYSIILNSRHADRYLITSDYEFADALANPQQHGVDYILSPKNDPSSAKSADNQMYNLFEDGAPWAELYKEFGGKWRLYKVKEVEGANE